MYVLKHQVVNRFNDQFYNDVVSSKWKVCTNIVSRVY